LDSGQIGAAPIQELSELLPTKEKLQTLSLLLWRYRTLPVQRHVLCSPTINDGTLQDLAQGILKMKALTSLTLMFVSGNFTEVGTKFLGNTFKAMPQLTDLTLWFE
jgi:hypothetical protein